MSGTLDSPAAWQCFLVDFFHAGDYHALEREAQRALAIWPEFVFGWKALGVAQQALGKNALVAAQRAVTLAPDDADALVNLGNILRERAQLDPALDALTKAVQLNPRQPIYRINLANAQRAAGRLQAAEENLRAAIALSPGLAEAHNNLAHTLFGQPGRLAESLAGYRQALALQPDFRAAADNLLFAMNYQAGSSPGEMLESAKSVAGRLPHGLDPLLPAGERQDRDKVLRVGLVSGDFRQHSVGNLLAPVLEQLADASLQIHVFANQTVDDAVSQRIRAAVAAWHPVWGVGDEAVARLVQAQGIDLLVDLSGYTAQNRLGVFARKPAPIQVAWLGYFATTGLATMDYVLGSPVVLPEREAGHFIERRWCLPQTYYVFEPPAAAVAPVAAASRTGPPVFGCFSNLAKLSEPMFTAWCEILRQLPAAQLYLKAPQLNSAEVRQAVEARFAAGGIRRERLRLEAASSYLDYLDAYRQIDLTLDTAPFPGGLTSCESLWMGVPVLTWRGDRFIGHQGEMILRALGLDDWIADDAADYVRRAVRYGERKTAPELCFLRDGLRRRLVDSPLCDVPRFAQDLAAAWRGMWARYCADAS